MRISPQMNDYSGFLQEGVPFEVTIFNKSSTFQCSGFLLAAHSAKSKTLVMENKEIYIENDNLESIVTLLHGGDVELTDENLLDFIKFGIHFDIPNLYQGCHSYRLNQLTEEKSSDYFFICQMANTFAKEFNVSYSFYGDYINLLYALSGAKLRNFLKKLFENVPHTFQLLICNEVFPIIIDFLPEFLSNWNPETLSFFLQHLDTLDHNSICLPKMIKLLKATQAAAGEDTALQEKLMRTRVLFIGSTIIPDFHLNLNPKDMILNRRVWNNMTHFYQVLALEQYFPGAEFCNMIKIYNDWGRNNSIYNQVKITCRIPRALLDVMEFQVNTNITECRNMSTNLVDEFIVHTFTENGNAIFETISADHARFDGKTDANDIKKRYLLDQDAGLTCEGNRYVNYIVMHCQLNESQRRSSANRLFHHRRYDVQFLGLKNYYQLQNLLGCKYGKTCSTHFTHVVRIFPPSFRIY